MHKTAETDFDFSRFFAEIKTIAVVGYSDKPERAGYFVAHYLVAQGYQVIGVNPKLTPLHDGVQVFASLADIPDTVSVDVIDVFRAAPAVPAIAVASAEMNPKPKYFFMQPGAESEAGWQAALDAGMIPIQDTCMLAAHRDLG